MREPSRGPARLNTMAHGMLRRVALVTGLLLAPLMWVGAEPAIACSCVRSSLADIADRNDVVASARLVDREVAGQELEYTFSGEALFKGDAPEEFVVRTSAQSSACGLTGLVVGRRYVLYVDEERDGFTTTSCDGTGRATPSYLSKVEAVTGPSTPLGATTAGQSSTATIDAARVVAAALSGPGRWG